MQTDEGSVSTLSMCWMSLWTGGWKRFPQPPLCTDRLRDLYSPQSPNQWTTEDPST